MLILGDSEVMGSCHPKRGSSLKGAAIILEEWQEGDWQEDIR